MKVYRNDGLFDDNFRVFRKKTRKCLVVSQKMTTFAPAIQMVPVVQLVRASDCGSECRGFESHRAPKIKACKSNTYKPFLFPF